MDYFFSGIKSLLYREGSMIFLSLAGFLLFPWLSRRVDATAAPLDPGVMSVIIMAVLSLLVFKAVTWWAIRVIWPAFAEYSTQSFEQDFTGLKPVQKVLIYLAFYMILLICFLVALSALI